MKFLRDIFIMSIVFVLSPFIAVADKSDDTLVIAFTREITNLDYNYGTKTEYIILGDMIDDSLFYELTILYFMSNLKTCLMLQAWHQISISLTKLRST